MDSDKIDFKNRKHIHFTGIKGVGQAALAMCARDLGIKVTGSDVAELFVTDETLKKARIVWTKGFSKENISRNVDLLVTTGAHGGFDNPEVKAAKTMGIDITSYAEAMSSLANTKKVITVVGVGGKTTTSSIIATAFERMSLNPSYVVGVGSIDPIGLPGKYDYKGDYFICEGDDYVVSPDHDKRAKFLLLNPHVVVVTNIEHDHPDIYPDLKSMIDVFNKLFRKIPKDGLLVANIDNNGVRKAIRNLHCNIATYGFTKDADYVVSNVKIINGKSMFEVSNLGKKTKLSIQVPGEYNVLNSAAAYIVGKHVGTPEDKLTSALKSYAGCKRRFEKIGKFKDASIVDDYAHHPEEIKSVLKAASVWYPEKRIVAVFQPHTYTRTKALFKEFSKSFERADLVGFMDIYSSAREKKDKNVSSEKLTKETSKYHPNSHYTGNHEATLDWIKEKVKKGDILLTLGAGDIFHLHKNLV